MYIAHVVFFHCPNVFVPSVISKGFHGVSGAVFILSKSYGAVRCGFYFIGNRTVQCGGGFDFFKEIRCGCSAVFLLNGAVRYGLQFQESHGAVRCGAVMYPFISCFLRCG